MDNWVVWLAGVLLVLIACVVAGWRVLARRHALPCPAACLWLLENRFMDRVAGSRVLLDRAGVRAGMTVLDAGCGPGRLTLPLAERVGPQARVLALDL
jgi:SAM-dependent methyltransferase